MMPYALINYGIKFIGISIRQACSIVTFPYSIETIIKRMKFCNNMVLYLLIHQAQAI